MNEKYCIEIYLNCKNLYVLFFLLLKIIVILVLRYLSECIVLGTYRYGQKKKKDIEHAKIHLLFSFFLH